jgi:hypothetical protein
VDLDYFRLAGVDPDLGKDRHQSLAECLELLSGIPDLADAEASLGAEADVVVESVGREVTGGFELADGLVVLGGRQGRGGKADKDAHRAPP